MEQKKPLTPGQKELRRRWQYAARKHRDEKAYKERLAEMLLNAGDDLSDPIHSMDPDMD